MDWPEQNNNRDGEQGGRPSERSYVSGIDGLRAIAVISVLIYHLDNSWLPGGFVGVDVFFVISGFVVSMTTRRLQVLTLSELLVAFYRRRVVRIFPAALIFIAVVQTASVLFIPAREKLTVSDTTAAAAAAGLSNLVLWRRASDYFSPSSILNPFTHTWSLAVEEQFYLLFPFFALLIWMRPQVAGARQAGIAWLCLAAALSLGFAGVVTQHDHAFAFYMLPTRFWELSAGLLLFAAIAPRIGAASTGACSDARAGTWPALIGSALFAGAVVWMPPHRFPFPGALLPVAASVLLIYVVSTSPASVVSRALSTPLLRYVGRISYSLYLWHWGVIILMLWTVGLDSLTAKLAAAMLSLLLADLSYRLVERPLRGSPWLAQRKSPQIVSMGVGAICLCGGLVAALTLLRPQLTLSQTGNFDVWLPTTPGSGGRCGAERTKVPFASEGTLFEFRPRPCAGSPDSRRLFVVGDSHAWAYQRLVGNIVRLDGLSANIYALSDCGTVSLVAKPTELCSVFINESLAAVRTTAKRGDVLFLPGLRTQRYRELWDHEMAAYRPPRPYPDEELAAEAARLQKVLDLGVRVVMEAPKPVYNYAPLRCMDWFNKNNPHCQVPDVRASEQQARRSYALLILERLRQLDPQLEIWDPFLLLCPGEICAAVQDGKPLVSDGDHLSGYGNDYLTPNFLALLDRSDTAPAIRLSAR